MFFHRRSRADAVRAPQIQGVGSLQKNPGTDLLENGRFCLSLDIAENADETGENA